MPKPTVPTAADAAAKWAEVTPGRSTYYEKNTKDKGAVWEANGKAAADTYKLAVSATDIAKRFAGGIKNAGAAKFARKVVDVGVGRFGPGVTAALKDMESGVTWVLKKIGETDMVARKPRGDAGNWARGKAIGDALNKERLARMAAGAA